MVNDLSGELARIASGVAPSPLLDTAALARGRRRAARRRAVRSGAAVALAVTGLGWYGVAGPSTAPASASVACYADRAVVARPHASVGRSGVRLDVTNATGQAVRVLAGDEAAIVPPGRSAVEVALRPGRVEVRCDTGSAVLAAPAALTVTDRHHVFVDDSLDCPRPQVAAFHGLGAVEAGDPVALTRAHLGRSLPAGTVVEPAGYPAAASRRLVRARQGTHIVGLAVWHEMVEPGTWTLDELRVCAP
ncbi:MAG TPA: hypothetical protein VFQ85_11600 [Mycobacteriales bacterium]|nr:hypothetical protein [Mycobacteriales bacterium]